MNFAQVYVHGQQVTKGNLMISKLKILFGVLVCLTVISCGKRTAPGSVNDQGSAGISTESTGPDLNSRYTITSTMEILKPVKIEAMSNDAQKTEIISENDLSIKVKITVDPLADQMSSLVPNSNWKNDYTSNANLNKYLAPGITTNWDEDMRSELLAALAKADIFPDQLSDVELVQKVSKWIFRSSEFQFQDHFISYDVEFKDGKAQVIPELQSHFESEKEKNKFTTDDEALAQGVFGKSMFHARKYGNCTYSATLQATVLKALGIPTRLVLMIPAIDWNDQSQWEMLRDNIHQHIVQKTVMQGLALQSVGSWGSHTFNEVYVGNKWVRLNYTTLGQKPADSQFFGLMLQVNEMSDWSEANLGRTWGIHAQSQNLVKLSSNNTFRTFAVTDKAELLTDTNNSLPAVAEIKSINLDQAYNADDMTLPESIKGNLKADPGFAVKINTGTQNPQYADIAVFRRNISREFLLKGSGVPDVQIYEVGSWFEPGLTALKFKPKDMNQLVDGVEYSLVSSSQSSDYKWLMDASLKFKKPSMQNPPSTPGMTTAQPQPPLQNGGFSTQATVLKARTIGSPEMKCPTGKTCIVLELAENIDLSNLNPITEFYTSVPMNFSIIAEGAALPLSFYGITGVQQGKKVGFVFTIDEGLMTSGIQYKVKYNSNLTQGRFSWVLGDDLTVTK